MATHDPIDEHIKNRCPGPDVVENLRDLYAQLLQELDKYNECGIDYGYGYYVGRADRLVAAAQIRDFDVVKVMWAAVAAILLDVLDHPNNPRHYK